MKVKEIGLCWIVVKDLNAAIKYYTEVVGLKLAEFHEEFAWAEVEAEDGGCRLGLAQENPEQKAGQNAVMTFSVANLDKAIEEMVKKGAVREGEVCEISGHVRMQSMIDPDGNRFQMCQVLHHSCCHC